jgi:gliding motility-associated-like protein
MHKVNIPSISSSIVINVYPTPQIDFTSDVDVACQHSPVQFTPSNNNMQLFWSFGDGATSGLSQPVHHYNTPGTFTVQLDALTTTGCSASATHNITVLNGPDAQLSAPQLVGCSPFQVCFSNTSSDSQFYTWHFGDGNSSNNTAPCHTFVHNGADAVTYTVQLIAQDMQLCRDTAEIQLIVSPQPISAFQLLGFDPCENNLSQHASGYQWSFNNSVISNDVNTSIAFTDIGTYVVQLTATNQYGCSASSSNTYVLEGVPQAALTATPRQGCTPLEVFFSNQSTNATNIVWDFGNGVTSNEDNPSFRYLVPGRYDITLVAMNENGCKDTLYLEDYIFVFPKPIADFWMEPSETTVFESQIEFHNTSVNAYTSLWYFGDGAYGEAHDTTYTYPNAGIWPITLTVWNMYGCKSEKKDAVIIHDMFNVYVPNSFTPDDDGINEVFLPAISGKSFIHKYVFRIYDRWGTTIFETSDYEEPWKGDVRGGEYYAKDEVYNWQIVIQLKGSDEERSYQGHVFLLR